MRLIKSVTEEKKQETHTALVSLPRDIYCFWDHIIFYHLTVMLEFQHIIAQRFTCLAQQILMEISAESHLCINFQKGSMQKK